MAAVDSSLPGANPPQWAPASGTRPAGEGVSRTRRLVVGLGLVLLAIVFAVACYLVYRYFVTTLAGQQLDAAAYQGAEIGRHYIIRLAAQILDVVSFVFVAVAVLVVGVIALGRRRFALGLAAVVLVAGSNVTTQLLKHLVLERPQLGTSGPSINSLPSGHTTVAASIAVALVLVVPRRFRVVTTLLAGGYATATAIATLSAGWHRPSDVVVALLVVASWLCVVTAVSQWWQPPAHKVGVTDPEQPLEAGLTRGAGVVTWGLVVLGVLAGVAAVLLLGRTGGSGTSTEARFDLLIAYGGGVAGIASAACVVFALALALAPVAARTPVR